MFYNASNFNKKLYSWDVSKVENIGYMFYEAILFNQDISSWDVSNVKKMRCMFEYCNIKEEYKPKFK